MWGLTLVVATLSKQSNNVALLPSGDEKRFGCLCCDVPMSSVTEVDIDRIVLRHMDSTLGLQIGGLERQVPVLVEKKERKKRKKDNEIVKSFYLSVLFIKL